MRPALSVLLLTTLIGAGQGLFIAIATTELLLALGGEGPRTIAPLLTVASLLSVLLSAAGLAASFFHLGHPMRAWRAAAGWRTSWLSREVIVLPLFMLVVAAYGLGHWLVPGQRIGLALLGIALAIALYVCTGMIYAAVKAIREWASSLTVVNYLLMGLASGFTLAAALATGFAPRLTLAYAAWALLLTVTAAVFRLAAQVRNARITPAATMQSAIGVNHPRVVQRSQGAMGGSFNTREFFHGKSPEFFLMMSRAFMPIGFALPALMLAVGVLADAGALASAAVVLAVPVQFVGLLIERWVFFAQASHPQNLYYRTVG